MANIPAISEEFLACHAVGFLTRGKFHCFTSACAIIASATGHFVKEHFALGKRLRTPLESGHKSSPYAASITDQIWNTRIADLPHAMIIFQQSGHTIKDQSSGLGVPGDNPALPIHRSSIPCSLPFETISQDLCKPQLSQLGWGRDARRLIPATFFIIVV